MVFLRYLLSEGYIKYAFYCNEYNFSGSNHEPKLTLSNYYHSKKINLWKVFQSSMIFYGKAILQLECYCRPVWSAFSVL
jgi:hypothetical protein